MTGQHRIAEQQAARAIAAQVGGDQASAAIEADPERGDAAAGHHRDGAIKLHRKIKGLGDAVGAIRRQGHLGDHRAIALVTGHVHQHRSRLDREGTSVILCHHSEGP